MSYEVNNNRYITLKTVSAWDVFDRKKATIDKGTEIDSVWASAIIVSDTERASFHALTQQQCLDKKVELGYIKLKV